MEAIFLKSFILIFICLFTAILLLHARQQELSPQLKIALGLIAFISIFSYTNYGNFHIVQKKDPAFIEATGSQSKSSLFHWHEVYHYYLGAKYYPENGHFGLYNSVALADSESSDPHIKGANMRDSKSVANYISIEEGMDRAENFHRPNFTDERWAEFKRDLEYLKSIGMKRWLELGLWDAGYNPPPTYSVVAYSLANIFPMGDSWFDYGIGWDQAEFLPLLDVIFFFIACFFVYRSFGYIGLCVFLIVFCTSYISRPHWIFGSFLRHMWLFALVLAICFVRDKRLLWAGVFFGLATCFRVFPIVFAGAVGLALLLHLRKDKKVFEDIIKFCIGFAAPCLVLITLSLIMFGTQLWAEFFENISLHKNIFFVQHIGYKKIATFDSWVPSQNFWFEEGLLRLGEWNQKLQASWDTLFAYHFPLIVISLGAATYVIKNKLPLEEASLLLGGMILFFFEIPANYYYSYMSLIPVVLFANANNKNWRDYFLISLFFLMWALMNYIPNNITRDDIVYTYYFCVLILIFFLSWVSIRLIKFEDIQKIINYKPAEKK